MPRVIRPTQIKVVPRDGEIEITLNINITLDGKIVASADEAETEVTATEEDDETNYMIPDFSSGLKLDFGKID